MRLICSFFLLIGSCASAGEKVRDLVMAGQTRHYREFIPADCAKKPCPVIFAFHGGGGDAAGAEKMFGFQDLGESAGFITVYPAGLSRNWNDGRGEVGATADDLGFFDLVYKDLAAHAQIDLKRVFATGISNGGMFSFRLACERSSVFAAVAPVAANMTKF